MYLAITFLKWSCFNVLLEDYMRQVWQYMIYCLQTCFSHGYSRNTAHLTLNNNQFLSHSILELRITNKGFSFIQWMKIFTLSKTQITLLSGGWLVISDTTLGQWCEGRSCKIYKCFVKLKFCTWNNIKMIKIPRCRVYQQK